MSEPSLTMTAIDGSDSALPPALASAHLPVSDLQETGRLLFRFDDAKGTIGFGGLELAGSYALLRSVVILNHARGRGLGTALVVALLDRARRDGIGTVYLLTETAEPFFARLGFRRISREEAPAEILATRQARDVCPASAALMAMDLGT